MHIFHAHVQMIIRITVHEQTYGPLETVTPVGIFAYFV